MRRTLVSLIGIACLAVTCCYVEAQSRPSAPAVSAARINQSLDWLSMMRRTPAFDVKFREAVVLITELNRSGSPADRIDAQDLAQRALTLYMDHNLIDAGTDPEQRRIKSRQVATSVGLLEVLGW